MAPPTRSIHVVAAVITDARGRVLLNRRTENRDMAGLWEFPGGKRESGETSEQALVRELREELGIEADVGEWLMDVPQRYPDKHLTLEVRHVRSWKGTPRGREGQAITWVAPDKLGRYSMPPADLPVVLTGDFNSEPGGDTYKAFTHVLEDTRPQVKAPQGPRLTFHDFTGNATAQLDWVLVRGFHARSFVTDDRLINGVLPSDHFPVVVELEWTSP